LQVSDTEIALTRAAFNLNNQRPIIGFCPGAEFGPAKRWPHYHYATLAQRLIDTGHQVILFGSAKDQLAGEQIRVALAEDARHFCHNLAGETQLEQAVILLAACQAVISNDSGLMHIAAALDKPLIALYGPSSPDFTPPLSNKAQVIRLISGYHKVRKGDADQGYHQSLIDISPQQVFDALLPLLTQHEA
jgi:heptosyltransferase-2